MNSIRRVNLKNSASVISPLMKLLKWSLRAKSEDGLGPRYTKQFTMP